MQSWDGAVAADGKQAEIGGWTVADARAQLDAGEVSAGELLEHYLSAAEAQRDLNIFVTEMPEQARAAAAESEARIAAGQARPLDGIPIAVKDNYCTAGTRTTAGSRMLETFVPTYDATVITKLREAGAVIVGKANMDEFAMGSSTDTSHFGPTINPAGVRLGLDNLVPGGSSGGSAAAVAAGLATASLGSDTGGSIRQPASFCGVVGMKPSYGVCSRWGIIAYGSSLDQAGALGRTVDDVARVMAAIAGPDDRDSTSWHGGTIDFNAAAARKPERLRIGFPREVRALENTAAVEAVWSRAEELAKDLGAERVEVSLPSLKHALPAYYIIALSEASSNLARYDGVRYGYRAENPEDLRDLYERTRAEGFGAETKRRILLGTYSLSAGYYDAYYLKALKVRRIIADEFRAAFEQADVIAMPTAPSGAFEIGAHSADPVEMYLQDMYTVPVNLAGLPALCLPVAQDARGMPLGLQVIGPQFGDETVVSAASAIEAALR